MTLESFDYPNVVVLERVLRGKPKLRPGIEPPFGTNYYEFRGIGVPPNEIGRPGDIFWDVTFPYILYVRGSQVWEGWNPRASTGSQLLAEHPCFLDRYLWFGGNGLSWFIHKSLHPEIDTKQFHMLSDDFQKELAAILCSSPSFKSLSLDISENRAKHDAEVARRHRRGVAVGQAPHVPVVSSLKRKRARAKPESDDIVASLPVPIAEMGIIWQCTGPQMKPLSGPKFNCGLTRVIVTEVQSLKTDNSRLTQSLQDSAELREELSARYTEALEKVEEIQQTKDDLEARLAEAEHKIKKMKKNTAKNDQEMEGLRMFKARISGIVGGMNIPRMGAAP
ncbi:hypothetical protein C8R44DRAFT_895407 [Mycena epipterygia]|nr:hypothetical protein C8R44DRAFT_895407 [Mycena epipterygia]